MQLALFDFDHTLTRCDTDARFLRVVATPAQLAQARWTVGPWLLGYRARIVSPARMRARATPVALTGRCAAALATRAMEYAAAELPRLLRPDMMARLAWHLGQGHRVVVVSGSLDLYLRPWCAQHGPELICNRLETVDGAATGRYAGGDVGARKAVEIGRHLHLPDYTRIHAYGDSREDRGMLALAHERWYRGRRVA